MSGVKTWMLYNKLQINEDKTEVLLVTPKRVVKSESFPEFMNINSTFVKFCPSLRNLGVILESTLLLHQHVLNVCRGAFLELRSINSIRNFLTTGAVKALAFHCFPICFNLNKHSRTSSILCFLKYSDNTLNLMIVSAYLTIMFAF